MPANVKDFNAVSKTALTCLLFQISLTQRSYQDGQLDLFHNVITFYPDQMKSVQVKEANSEYVSLCADLVIPGQGKGQCCLEAWKDFFFFKCGKVCVGPIMSNRKVSATQDGRP